MTHRRPSLRLSLTVPAELPQLKFLTGMIERFLSDGAGIGPERRDHQQLQLAVREVSSNVIRHAYKGSGAGPLRLQLRIVSRGVHIRIQDLGCPVPVAILRNCEEGPRRDPADLAEGGYGLLLIREAVDRVAYREKNGVNSVYLYKEFLKAA